MFIYALFAAGLDFDHCDNSETKEDNKSKQCSLKILQSVYAVLDYPSS